MHCPLRLHLSGLQTINDDVSTRWGADYGLSDCKAQHWTTDSNPRTTVLGYTSRRQQPSQTKEGESQCTLDVALGRTAGGTMVPSMTRPIMWNLPPVAACSMGWTYYTVHTTHKRKRLRCTKTLPSKQSHQSKKCHVVIDGSYVQSVMTLALKALRNGNSHSVIATSKVLPSNSSRLGTRI